MNTTKDAKDDEPGESTTDTPLKGEAILDRARAVGERITRRCRQVAAKAGPDDSADRKD